MLDYSPLRFYCPNCQALANRACTQPTDAGRKAVSWFHLARENEAEYEREKMRSIYASAEVVQVVSAEDVKPGMVTTLGTVLEVVEASFLGDPAIRIHTDISHRGLYRRKENVGLIKRSGE